MKYTSKKIFKLFEGWASKMEKSWERGENSLTFNHQNNQWSVSGESQSADTKENFIFNQINTLLKQAKAQGRDIDLSLSLKSLHLNSNKDEENAFKLLVYNLMLDGSNSRHLAQSLDNVYDFGQSVFHVKNIREDEATLNQILKIDCIKDVTQTFFDYGAPSPTFHDGKFCGIKRKISRKALMKKYKGTLKEAILKKDDNEIVDFWYKKKVPATYILLTTGEYKREDLINKQHDSVVEEAPIKGERTIIGYCRVLEDCERFLEKQDLDYEFLPMVLNNGGMPWIGQEINTYPFGYYLQDSQILLNYCGSTIADIMKTQTSDIWLFEEQHIQGDSKKKDNARDINKIDGGVEFSGDVSRIRRETATPIQGSLLGFFGQMQQTLKNLAGSYFDENGAKLKEMSGVALDKVFNRMDLAQNPVIIAHLHAINILGEVMRAMIPVYYTQNRTIEVTDELGVVKNIEINKEEAQPNGMIAVKNNIKNLSKNYTYKISVSPSRRLQKQNVLTELQTLYQAYPQAIPATIDIYTQNLDIQGAEIISRRLGANIPQSLLEYGNGTLTYPQYEQKMQAEQQQHMQQAAQMQQNSPQAQFMKAKTQGEQSRSQTAAYAAQTARFKEVSAAQSNHIDSVSNATKTQFENENTQKHNHLEMLKLQSSHLNNMIDKFDLGQ